MRPTHATERDVGAARGAAVAPSRTVLVLALRASRSAAQLLAFNYRVLGTWLLALTAYNRRRTTMAPRECAAPSSRRAGPTS